MVDPSRTELVRVEFASSQTGLEGEFYTVFGRLFWYKHVLHIHQSDLETTPTMQIMYPCTQRCNIPEPRISQDEE